MLFDRQIARFAAAPQPPSDRADQHEAGIFFRRQRAGKFDRRKRRLFRELLDGGHAIDMGGLAEIVVGLQEDARASGNAIEPRPQIGDVLAARVDDQVVA